jgi:hypothetical protein
VPMLVTSMGWPVAKIGMSSKSSAAISITPIKRGECTPPVAKRGF